MVQPGPEAPRSWLPNLVRAPSPTAKDRTVTLVVDAAMLRRLCDGHFNHAIGQYVGLIHGGGLAPPGQAQPGNGLMKAVALFQGLHRPLNNHHRDSETYVYVLTSAHTYAFQDPHSGGPTRISAPVDSVFVVYAEISDASKKLLHWEWVRAEQHDNGELLPQASGGRYRRRVW